jgi:cytosine/adenosine deaminase-related metal-dependent hydrolase
VLPARARSAAILIAAAAMVPVHAGALSLSAAQGPAIQDVTLAWSGDQPIFQLYRSTIASSVAQPGNLLTETVDRTFVDPEVPVSGAFFYLISRKPDPPPSIVDGAETRVLLKGTIVGPAGPFAGEVLVEGNLLTCVSPSCSAMPGAAGATVITTNGIILPGLIDAHNHGLFDVFDESDWSPAQLYTNHNQWTAESRYQEMVDAKQYLNSEGTSPVDYGCEMDKYAEIKALIAGTTSYLLAPGLTRSCFASLIRTIDTPQNDLGADRIQTSISVPSNTTAQSVCNNFASGATTAYVVHVAEGVDQTARNEFATLAGRAGGCLISPHTTIVHGTALGTSEFATMAGAGMKLVWSPRSNMFLYGGTTRIDVALQAGVSTIALAPDWSLGGSVNLLDELRFADEVDRDLFGDVLTPERLFRMVTIDAARALAVDTVLGSLEVGKRADLMVIDGYGPAPYDALMLATPVSVRLAVVDGRALYGDIALLTAGPAVPGCETIPVCGSDKFVCAAESSTLNKLNQTYAEIATTLLNATSDYDTNVLPAGSPPFSPIAPLTTCP